ncbi:urease accessory protein [Ophiostoma piceae UAMH 11346]|uniref:Urease accessory protein n=1 Tax=Ophiostoma piceae (strain UAMH 11346) TaxID=1262450 RepID=S3C7H4_OPHP1|nr:urease accessory protein [Ophiostoma piceae UAMH 11346]
MISPFPPSTATPGYGRIVAALEPNGDPGLEVVAYQYPLKLIAPTTGAGLGTLGPVGNVPDDPARKKSALIFLLSYGGGLVAGDQVNLDVEVRKRARLSLVTQGTTKVFKASGDGRLARVEEPTRQTLTMNVAPGAGLCLLPDPVQPFADSVYEQVQVITLDERLQDGEVAPSLCLLDWVTQGRAARGENWDFASWKGRNEVWLETEQRKRLLVRDSVMLAPGYLDGGFPQERPSDEASAALRESLQGLAVFGTLILRGPLVDSAGRFFMDEFAALPRLGARGFHADDGDDARAGSAAKDEHDKWRRTRLQQEHAQGVLWSAAAVRGCVVVKFGARSVEGGRLWIGAMLQREGSVGAAFGDEALMCVR